MMKKNPYKSLATVVALASTVLIATPSAVAQDTSHKALTGQNLKAQFHPAEARGRNDGRGHSGSNGPTALIECGSGSYNSNTCYIRGGFRIADARVYKRKSKSDCDRGQDWGLRGNQIWVKNGCRAVFEVSSQKYRDQYSDRRYSYNDDDRYQRRSNNGDRGRSPYDNGNLVRIVSRDVNQAIRTCESEGRQIACNRGREGAAYIGRPNVDVDRNGVIRIDGGMRSWGRQGERRVSTSCAVRNGRILDFDIYR